MTRMRLLRKTLSLTLHDIQKRTGMASSRLSLIERGLEAPKSYELRGIALALNFPSSQDPLLLTSKIGTEELIAIVAPTDNK